ncbi:MAG: flagellar biosynthesis protein FlhF [Spirochaetales bacterium]|nr:flagellar biosynthesis protein FlhF [Spirochaetales bacterium]
MELVSDTARTFDEAIRKIRSKYSTMDVTPRFRRPVRIGGFFGFFGREGIEVTCALAPRRVQAGEKAEKEKILALAREPKEEGGAALRELVKEVQALREKISSPPAVYQQGGAHPSIEKISALLADNEFSASYSADIQERLKKEFSLEELENFPAVEDAVVDWIGESISIYRQKKAPGPLVYILVGPTGVGKTTTIAKLAAMHGPPIGGFAQQQGLSVAKLAAMSGLPHVERPLDVRIITIDDYRLGAEEQLNKYGEIMRIPVICTPTALEFKKQLALFREADMIFVDTVGRSPNDLVKLAGMKELLKVTTGTSSFHLALSATTKTQDMLEIMRQFEFFGYESLVITKLDETSRVGSAVSAAAQRRVPLSYITYGQVVPVDLRGASAAQLLLRLAGFRLRKDHIEKKFGILEE